MTLTSLKLKETEELFVPDVPLSQKTAVVLTIDLNAICNNYLYLQKKIGPNVVCAATVKADAYGHGLLPVSKALSNVGCKDFFVATFEEGILLRKELPDVRIYALNGLYPYTEEDYLQYNLTPVLSDLPQIKIWSEMSKKRLAHSPDAKPLTAILHVDTGMARLGLSPKEVTYLLENLELLSPLKITYVMSHLACADEPQNPMNQEQLEKFKEFRKLFPSVKASFANTDGMFLGPDYYFDMVRPGYALYGGHKTAALDHLMEPAAKLWAKILYTREVDTGQTVGYNATYKATNKGRLAVIGMGYADGYPRSLSNKDCIFIAGHKVKIAGRVSMDIITLDVSHLPENLAQPGDWVELIGDNIPLSTLAPLAEVNSYEFMTRLGKRYERYYKD